MKTKLLTLGLAVALCGVAEARENSELKNQKLELNVDVDTSKKIYTLTAVDKNGKQVGSVTYNTKDCNLPTPKTLRCFSGCHSLLTPEQENQVKTALAKAALQHALKNGCDQRIFKADNKATADLYKKEGAKTFPVTGEGEGLYLVINQ